MRWLLIPTLIAATAGPAAAQGFAPAQSRAATPQPPPSRVAATNTRPGIPSGLEAPMLSTGAPVPVPLGMAEPGSALGVMSGRVSTSGALVTLPPSAVANGGRLYTYTNAQGGLESVAYDPTTGATVVYDQSTTYSLQNRLGRFGFGPGDIPRVGSSSGAGIVNNPSFSLQPGQAIPASGIPLLNQASPSYDSRTNLGLGPTSVSSPSSPFAGTPMGTFNLGSGPVTSPFAGTPMGTLGAGAGVPSSPFSGTPLGNFGSAPTPSVGIATPTLSIGGNP